MRSRACCFLCFVQVGGDTTSNAKARIASARVIDVNVAGLNARSLIGTSISRSSCCRSRDMMFCRCKPIARSARSSSLPSLRCRYSSCDSLRKSSLLADCASTNRAKHFSNCDAGICPLRILVTAPVSFSCKSAGDSNPALTDSFTDHRAWQVTKPLPVLPPGQYGSIPSLSSESAYCFIPRSSVARYSTSRSCRLGKYSSRFVSKL